MFSQNGYVRNVLVTGVICCIVLVGIYHFFIAPPSIFPVPYDLVVTTGETSGSIARQLADDGLVRSRRAFQVWMVLLGNDTHISEGEYYFDKPVSSLQLALRIAGKEFGISKTKVTFPEGYTNQDMANRLKELFPLFDTGTFLTTTNTLQGYLFPDTYKFFKTPQPAQVIAELQHNYEQKVAPLRADILASGHSENDIIVMASLIEKEAQGSTDSPVIAGILWKRIQNNMSLQVDALPSTYSHKGLPATPIDNPGLVAIQAALYPVASPYLYYLHDAHGVVHYASTYKQHQQNIKKYL